MALFFAAGASSFAQSAGQNGPAEDWPRAPLAGGAADLEDHEARKRREESNIDKEGFLVRFAPTWGTHMDPRLDGFSAGILAQFQYYVRAFAFGFGVGADYLGLKTTTKYLPGVKGYSAATENARLSIEAGLDVTPLALIGQRPWESVEPYFGGRVGVSGILPAASQIDVYDAPYWSLEGGLMFFPRGRGGLTLQLGARYQRYWSPWYGNALDFEPFAAVKGGAAAYEGKQWMAILGVGVRI